MTQGQNLLLNFDKVIKAASRTNELENLVDDFKAEQDAQATNKFSNFSTANTKHTDVGIGKISFSTNNLQLECLCESFLNATRTQGPLFMLQLMQKLENPL